MTIANSERASSVYDGDGAERLGRLQECGAQKVNRMYVTSTDLKNEPFRDVRASAGALAYVV